MIRNLTIYREIILSLNLRLWKLLSSDSENGEGHKDQHTSCVDVESYSSEPMADEEWIAEYRLRQAQKEQRLASLKERLEGKESLSNWYAS